MPIKLKCSCGQVLTVPDAMAGKTGKCPKCQKAIKIPAPATAAPASDGAAKPPAAAPQAATAKPAAAKPSAAKPSAAKPSAAKPAAAKPTTAKPSAAKPAVARPTAERPGAAARGGAGAAPHLDQLFDEIGLTKQTGPVCPKCGGSIAATATLCTHCGFNLQTGEQAIGFQARAAQAEFTNPYLQEAANHMRADVVSAERHSKAGMPWWMLASFLLGAICIGLAGVVIVDATLNEPAPEGTFLGRVQRQAFSVVIGVTLTAVGGLVGSFANLSIIIFAFRESIGRGFAVWLIPFYSIIYGCMTWADNKSGIIGLIVGIVLSSIGVAMTISGGGVVM